MCIRMIEFLKEGKFVFGLSYLKGYMHMFLYVWTCYENLFYCVVGCILRMPGSPMNECACFNVQEEDPRLGIILNTRETLSEFPEKLCVEKLVRGLVPYALVTV